MRFERVEHTPVRLELPAPASALRAPREVPERPGSRAAPWVGGILPGLPPPPALVSLAGGENASGPTSSSRSRLARPPLAPPRWLERRGRRGWFELPGLLDVEPRPEPAPLLRTPWVIAGPCFLTLPDPSGLRNRNLGLGGWSW